MALVFLPPLNISQRVFTYFLRQYSKVLYLILKSRLNICSYSNPPLFPRALSSIHMLLVGVQCMMTLCINHCAASHGKLLFAELMTFSACSGGSQLLLRTVYKGHINCWVSWKNLCTGYVFFHASS